MSEYSVKRDGREIDLTKLEPRKFCLAYNAIVKLMRDSAFGDAWTITAFNNAANVLLVAQAIEWDKSSGKMQEILFDNEWI